VILTKPTETLAIQRRVASSHESTARTLLILGRVKVEQRRFDEARPFLQEALELFREHSASRRELVAQAANWLGAIHVARQAYSEAENLLLLDPDQFIAQTSQLSIAERRAGLNHIVQLYQKWGKPDRAAAWQLKLDQVPLPSAK
jgi:tetratricopeptide (TPR) repeat protein